MNYWLIQIKRIIKRLYSILDGIGSRICSTFICYLKFQVRSAMNPKFSRYISPVSAESDNPIVNADTFGTL